MKSGLVSRLIARFGAFLIVGAGVTAYGANATEPADLILTNAKVYSLDWGEPAADGAPAADAPYSPERGWSPDGSALAVDQGKVLLVGSNQDVEPYAGPDTRIIDLKGATVLPGFVDSHAHVADIGEEGSYIEVRDATPEEVIEALMRNAGNYKPGEWIIALGFDEGVWSSAGMPDWNILNELFPDNPVVVFGKWLFGAWSNRLAFDAAGIDASTPDPVGGTIEHDASGALTGILTNNAVQLMSDAIPEFSHERWKEFVLTGGRAMARDGYVAAHEAGIYSAADKAWHELALADALPIRVYGLVSIDAEEAAQVWLERGPYASPNNTYIARSVKAYYDGTLGSRGARLLEDYSDQPGYRGVSGDDYGFDQALAERFMQAGFQIGIHAIGDAGNRETLDFIESVISRHPETQAKRHRIEHAQIINPDDFDRFAKLDVIASLQPSHAVEDMAFAEDRLGEARLNGAYAWRSLRQNGARLAFGSDLPGIDHSLFYGLHSSVTRRNKALQPEGGWLPHERLSVEEAVRAFTAWPAYAGLLENETGTLAPGKWADITVIDRDPFQVLNSDAPEAFLDGQVVMTIMGGQITYENEADSQ